MPIARDSILIGASAAIFGVMLAYAVRWPNDEFLLWWVVPVKAKWLVASLALFNIIVGVYTLGAVDAGGGTAYFAHLGALAAGWLYLHTPPTQALTGSANGWRRLPKFPMSHPTRSRAPFRAPAPTWTKSLPRAKRLSFVNAPRPLHRPHARP